MNHPINFLLTYMQLLLCNMFVNLPYNTLVLTAFCKAAHLHKLNMNVYFNNNGL